MLSNPQTPDYAQASLEWNNPDVRVFIKTRQGEYREYNSASTSLNADNLFSGIEFQVEAKDLPKTREESLVTFTARLQFDAGDRIHFSSDRVVMRIAPLMFHHHLDAAEKAFISPSNTVPNISRSRGTWASPQRLRV